MRGYAKSRRSIFSKLLKLFLRTKDLARQKCRISLPPLMSVTDWRITISLIKRLFSPTCYNMPCRGALKLMQDARVQPGTPWDRLRWLTTAILRGAQDEPEYEMLILQAVTNTAVPRETHEMVLQESRL